MPNPEKKGDNPGVMTATLCAAYRDTLKTEILDLKTDFTRMENRQYMMLAGIILTILLTILGILCR